MGAIRPPPLLGFWPFTKKSKGNQYIKLLETFCCGSPYEEEKKSKNLVLPPLRGFLCLVGKIAHGDEGKISMKHFIGQVQVLVVK